MCVCVCACVCYILSTKIHILPAMSGHFCSLRTFWPALTRSKDCVRPGFKGWVRVLVRELAGVGLGNTPGL